MNRSLRFDKKKSARGSGRESNSGGTKEINNYREVKGVEDARSAAVSALGYKQAS